MATDSRQQPGNRALQVQAAETLLAVGKADEGLALLQRVLDREPTHAGAHRALADYYDKQGQPDRAKQHRRLAAGSP